MGKKCLRMFMICLLLITGLAGCGGNEDPATSDSGSKQTPSIAYRENEIKLSKLERVANMALDSQDRLVLFDQAGAKSKFVVLDKQGKEIRQIPCPAQFQDNDYVDGSVFALDKHDRLYQLQQINVNDNADGDQPREFIKRLQIYNFDGKLEKTIELGRMSGENSMDLQAANMVADDKGRLYILYYGGKIEITDQTGKPLNTITGAKYRYMDLDERGNLMVISRVGSDYFLARINTTGETIWKHKLGEIKTSVMGFKYNSHDGCSYIADYSGIKKYDSKGNFVGEVLNYRSTSIFVADSYINSLNFDAAGKIYISLEYNGASASGQQFSVFKYSREKAAAKVRQQKVVTVGTADPDSLTLEKAARLFEKKHPDIRVEIKDYAPGQMRQNDGERYENYVKAMNTEILSGQGPDIISIQGLPYDKYIDKNVFVDLKGLMKKDKSFKRQDYYPNILKACEHQGKLYGMPVSFSLPVIIADGGMLEKANLSIDDARWTWSDFHAAAKKLSQDTNNDGKLETYALPGPADGRMLDYMLASDYRSFIDEDKKVAHFNSARFVQFLHMYQDLNGTFMNAKVDRGSLIFSGNRSSIAFLPDEYFSGDLSMPKCEMGSQAQALAMPQGAGCEDKSFDAVMLGINQNSKLPKEAWEFLKFLTSTEQQSSLQLNGMCINRLAQDQSFKQLSQLETGCFTIGDGKNTKTVQQEPLTPEKIARTRQLIAGLNHCNNMNPQIKKIIDTEVASFIKGEKSATQTAKILQNKVTLYLNE